MALQAPRKKSNGLFLYIAIVLVGLVGGYLYYSFIITPAKQPIILPDIPREDTLSKFRDVKTFNFTIFAENSFRSLKILGEAPVQPGTTGREDIFAPF